MKPTHHPIDRRNMLRSLFRYATLGGCGLLAWKLTSRKDGDCWSTPTCTDCQLLAHCRLPQAQQNRKTP